MAANIPDSRLGRALRAGIPVALILLGAELLEGTWKLEHREDGLALSWSPPAHDDAAFGLLALADRVSLFVWRDRSEGRNGRIAGLLR